MTEQLDIFANPQKEQCKKEIEFVCYKYDMKLFQFNTCTYCEHKNPEKENELVYFEFKKKTVNSACMHPLKRKDK